MQATIVFQKIWDAINERNTDGTRRYRYIILTGSSRSSKTHSILQSHHLQALCNTWRISIWRETKKDTKDTVLADFKKALPLMDQAENIIFNKTESIFTYPSSSTIEMVGGDDDIKVHGFQSDVSHFNEPYGFSRDTFDQIDMRTSEYVIIDWNPRQKHFIDDISKLDNAIVIHSTWRDNPFVPHEQKTKILSYQPVKFANVVTSGLITPESAKNYDITVNHLNFTEKQLKELKRTQYNEANATASDYNHLVYSEGLKAENKRKIFHGFTKITREEYDNVKSENMAYYGLDFGFANPSACVEVLFDGNAFYIRQKLYKPMRLLTVPLGQVLIDLGIPTGNVTYVWADSADREAGSDVSQINDLRTYYNINAVPTRKPTYKERFEFINKSRVYYCESSVDFESEYDGYEYEYINGIPTERPIKKNDHLMDATSYCIMGIKQHLGLAL